MKDLIYTAYWYVEWDLLELWADSDAPVWVLVEVFKSLGMVISL